MKVGHWLFRKLGLCQKELKKKKKTTTFLMTAGSIGISVDIVVFCGGVFFPKGQKFSLTPNCLFRLLPEGELSLGGKKCVFQESFIKIRILLPDLEQRSAKNCPHRRSYLDSVATDEHQRFSFMYCLYVT